MLFSTRKISVWISSLEGIITVESINNLKKVLDKIWYSQEVCMIGNLTCLELEIEVYLWKVKCDIVF